jgi:hypothetical protein
VLYRDTLNHQSAKGLILLHLHASVLRKKLRRAPHAVLAPVNLNCYFLTLTIHVIKSKKDEQAGKNKQDRCYL